MFDFGAKIRTASPQEYILHPLSYSWTHKRKYLDLNVVMPFVSSFNLDGCLCHSVTLLHAVSRNPTTTIRYTLRPLTHTSAQNLLRLFVLIWSALSRFALTLWIHSRPTLATENVYLWMRAANSVTSSRYSVTSSLHVWILHTILYILLTVLGEMES